MIVMIEATFPGTKAEEAATKFLERLKTDPPPEYVKIIDMYALAGGDGIRTLIFYEVGKGKEDEGYKHIARGAVHLIREVEGYRANVLTVYNMAEAFEFLDMKAPAV